MRGVDVLVLCWELVFRYLPIIADTGLQVWNGVEINEIALQGIQINYHTKVQLLLDLRWILLP